ncbi:agglutinin biogenesis protein MshP [Janthinobacterium sp. TB1-E2]|uniref:Agglutinin biogenesis protein MshP n=1 Tax=Janthinobacterium aestuarii TaxID=2985511 RepID=A0ABZ2GI04_9BURK|nr:agglutinin biogenesis protein MshP [Janthinobacterium sp. GMG2]MDX8121686.1 agglutinin biogenesis protein MshP [Janthinobacterium sp. GMG2]
MTTFSLRRMRGFSLVTAIFLLVVLAGLGAAMVNIFTLQQVESALDVQGVRAEQAARAGIEWGVYRQLVDGQCDPVKSFALPAGTSLSIFSVNVQCSRGTGPGTLTSWTITATACNQPGPAGCPNAGNNPDYVQRRLQAVLSQ